MKRILLVLVATVFLFTGCASVKYTVVDSGAYLQQNIQINLDSEALSTKSLAVDDVKAEVSAVVGRLHESSHNYFLNNIQALVVNEALSPEEANALMDAVRVTKGWVNDTAYMYEIVFVGVAIPTMTLSYTEVFYLYNYGSTIPPEDDEEDGNGNVLTFDFLSTRVSNTQSTAFASADSIVTYFTDAFGAYGFDENDVKYLYTYGTEYRRLHSDADEIKCVDGVYMHTWQLSDRADEITLYRLIPNTTGWYIIALCAGVATAIVVGVIAIVRKRKR